MKRLFGFYICSFIALLFVFVFLLPTLVEADASTLVSDDFNSFNLDTGIWEFTDPVGDATLMMTGTNTSDAWVSISVPAGTSHDVWKEGNKAPRIMQPISDTDFEIEVKFESPLTRTYQMQGVLVEQDDDDFLRFEFYSDNSGTRLLAAIFEPDPSPPPPLKSTVKYNQQITDTNVAPLYMRVKREGDLWTQSYSYDGVTWTSSISFTHPLSVVWGGTYAGNASGTSSPAHTAHIDYFFNTASPIDPEDGGTAVDTTPPLIYNVQDVVGQTRLRVNWSTDEPTTGTVQYGETLSYELGSVSHTDYTLHHTLLITDLQADTLYNYQIISQDSIGNSSSTVNFEVTTDPSGTSPNPIIDIWYGSPQVFGDIGIPQQWINVLGNVSDSEGVASLTYSLNGGSESPLSIGPDTRRLASEGDFNVDIAYTDVVSGPNQVVITATDELDNTAVETVTVQYVDGNVWPETYSIDWSSATSIQDVAQVVDGLWTLEADSVRPAILGYDRLVAIGDVSWDDYEVTVPITIHQVDMDTDPASGYPGLGILMRWTGHTDSPISGWQPKTGWDPFGAIGWWRWSSASSATLQFYQTGISQSFSPALEVPYMFKMRVESVAGQGGLYNLKVWEDGQPEPSAWNLTYQADSSNLDHGSFMLLAHHVDASFGDVTVTPGPFSDTVPPVISNIQVTPGETSATVTWTTNEPATSSVAYGQTTAYEEGSVTDSALVTDHVITLTDLISGTLYHYQITSEDESGNSASSTDLTFRTTGVASFIVSDDFNACTLDTNLWQFLDPVGDATQAMTGTFTEDAWLSISVPAGTDHDIWTAGNRAPRIMQPISDTDFEIEVKFESPLTQTFQMQGVLVEQDSDDFLRFDFHSASANTRIYAAIFESGSPTEKYNQPITSTNVAPLYMRVKREGDLWTQSYSYDSVTWTPSVSFTHPLSVTWMGAFAGNASGTSSPPAHTAHIDYFFNTASPIDPEDGDRNTLTVGVNPVGSGEVYTDPSKSTYGCYEEVTLTATADPGWTFDSWSGNLSGTTNPVTVTMTGSRVITATFTQDEYTLTVGVNPVGSGSVSREPDQPTYHYGDVVTLTATANTGWTFDGWSGDLFGVTNPTTLTMDSHKAVTATFTQDEYTLTVGVNPVGSGSVSREPDQPTYHYGDVVTLTVTANTGWTFDSWSGPDAGELSDNGDGTWSITMDGNKSVTATFTQGGDNYQIFLPLITVQYSL